MALEPRLRILHPMKRIARGNTRYVSEAAHRRPKGRLVEERVEHEIVDRTGPWTQPEGLALQQRALEAVWADPALEVYDDA